MRLIKQQSTNTRSPAGKRAIVYDINGQVIINSTNSLVVPKGTTAERPAGMDDGYIRYNTDLGQFEMYSRGDWGSIPNEGDAIAFAVALG